MMHKQKAMVSKASATSTIAMAKESSLAKEPMVAMAGTTGLADRIEIVGRFLVRYGLVLVIAWVGAMKFTEYEAKAIEGLVANSPMLSWAYGIFSLQGFSNLLGVIEVSIAVLIALKPLSTKLSIVGSALAIPMFLTTLSFMLSTPLTFEASLGGFPALSVLPGQFLIKDLVLLGAAVWTLGDSLKA